MVLDFQFFNIFLQHAIKQLYSILLLIYSIFFILLQSLVKIYYRYKHRFEKRPSDSRIDFGINLIRKLGYSLFSIEVSIIPIPGNGLLSSKVVMLWSKLSVIHWVNLSIQPLILRHKNWLFISLCLVVEDTMNQLRAPSQYVFWSCCMVDY